MNRVEYWVEPWEELREELDEFTPEMSRWESAILTGLLKKYQPKKVVELGVAEGATTCLIMRTLEKIEKETGEKAQVHSVDLSETLWCDRSKKVGYQFINACQKGVIDDSNHQFYIGKYFPEYIDEIGGDIDFIIIDTVHRAPGELLDLLVCIPYMAPNAVIAFHDILLCYTKDTGDRARHINMLCFNVLRGKKYMNLEYKDGYASLGAVEMTEETRANVEDLFMLLLFPWYYMLSEKEYNLYKNKYRELYGEHYEKLFVQFAKMNEKNIYNHINIYGRLDSADAIIQVPDKMGFQEFCKQGNLYLYGTGGRGRSLFSFLNRMGCDVKGFVVSDGYLKEEKINNLPVVELSKLDSKANIVVASCFDRVIENLNHADRTYFAPSDSLINEIEGWCDF